MAFKQSPTFHPSLHIYSLPTVTALLLKPASGWIFNVTSRVLHPLDPDLSPELPLPLLPPLPTLLWLQGLFSIS